MARITFHGGAESVTGANTLVETGTFSFLVDCGIEQRESLCAEVNKGPFSQDTIAAQALIITHAHQDHIGRVPKLVREGFRGAIYSTPATKDLSALMFADALSVMRENTDECEPLYDEKDIEQTLALWRTHEYHEQFTLGEDTTATFLDAGHILGSAMVRCERGGKTLLFSGDLGNSPEPLLCDTESPAGAHYIVMESVYGDRVHEGRAERTEKLRAIVENVRAENGVLLIPSFSLERTQVLLYELNTMVENGALAPIPVYLDAPLAIRVTDVYANRKDAMNDAVRERYARGDDPFSFKGLTLTLERRDSEAIHASGNPKIIIAGAGMSHGGRIREHERMYLSDKHTTVLFVGYQSPGSLGRRILDGAHEVEIDGVRVKVRAKTETIFSYSGHKDRDGLLAFAGEAAQSAKKIFVAMGEPRASLFLAQRIRDFYGVDAVVPRHGQSFEIEW